MRALVAVLALVAASGSQPVGQDLPPELAAYRSWKTVNHHPVLVPLELWLRCSHVLPDDYDQGRKASGPHFDRYAHTYLNPAALATLSAEGNHPFPAGAIVAKAKFTDSTASKVDGIAFMIKHPKGEFDTSGGWEFRYYPGRPNGSLKQCIECHRDGNSRDYVFARLPRADSPF